MKERGIIFCVEMVRAIREGRKTMTRRIIHPQPEIRDGFVYGDVKCGGSEAFFRRAPWHFASPAYKPGDRLYVRETHQFEVDPDGVITGIRYRADNLWYGVNCAADGTYSLSGVFGSANGETKIWGPSIFLPKWAARDWLEITAVRAERVQEITEEDAKAEGCTGWENNQPTATKDDAWREFQAAWSTLDIDPLARKTLCRERFHILWEKLHGDGAWARNDWVWAISFRRVAK